LALGLASLVLASASLSLVVFLAYEESFFSLPLPSPLATSAP